MIEAYGNWRWMRRRNRKYLDARNQKLVQHGFPKRARKELTEHQFLEYDRITWGRKRLRYFFAADVSNKSRWEKVMA